MPGGLPLKPYKPVQRVGRGVNQWNFPYILFEWSLGTMGLLKLYQIDELNKQLCTKSIVFYRITNCLLCYLIFSTFVCIGLKYVYCSFFWIKIGCKIWEFNPPSFIRFTARIQNCEVFTPRNAKNLIEKERKKIKSWWLGMNGVGP